MLPELMAEIFLASLGIGLLAGLLAGLFGIGGGLVIVPALAFLFKANGFPADMILLMAIATSLATIIFTAISSILAHHRLGSVLWPYVWRLGPFIVVGSAAGAVVAELISAVALRYVLIAFLCYAGLLLAWPSKPKSNLNVAKPPLWLDYIVALLIGIMSAIVGIGGGTLTVPYLVFAQVPMRNAVAVSSACGLPIAVAGTLSYAVLGWDVADLPAGSLGYVYLPAFAGIGLTSILTAPIGAKLASQLPAATLKRYFSLLLWLMALKLVWQ